MNLSIAEEFLKFKKLFFIDTANNKKLISHLKNQVYGHNNEVKSLQDKIFALNNLLNKKLRVGGMGNYIKLPINRLSGLLVAHPNESIVIQ